MALANQLKKLVQQAFVSLDDLVDVVTYTRVVVTGAFDPSTDSVTKTETVFTNVTGLLVKLTEDDQDWMVPNTNMQKFLCPYNNLPIVPTDDDYLTIEGVRWNVHKIKQVPGRSLHIIYIREP